MRSVLEFAKENSHVPATREEMIQLSEEGSCFVLFVCLDEG